jgi:hypothetical protein
MVMRFEACDNGHAHQGQKMRARRAFIDAQGASIHMSA